MKGFMDWVRNHSVRKDVETILHLPLIERLTHRASKKAIMFFTFGVLIMMVGVEISLHSKHYESEWIHRLGDMIGFLIHAIGAIPCIRYIEPIFIVLFGVAE